MFFFQVLGPRPLFLSWTELRVFGGFFPFLPVGKKRHLWTHRLNGQLLAFLFTTLDWGLFLHINSYRFLAQAFRSKQIWRLLCESKHVRNIEGSWKKVLKKASDSTSGWFPTIPVWPANAARSKIQDEVLVQDHLRNVEETYLSAITDRVRLVLPQRPSSSAITLNYTA